METLFTASNITFTLGLLAILFSVYSYFKTPQVDAEKKDALLAQQVQWQTEATEKKFTEMNERFNGLLLQSNNHIHTLDTKIDALIDRHSSNTKELVRLSTIIEERIPRKGL